MKNVAYNYVCLSGQRCERIVYNMARCPQVVIKQNQQRNLWNHPGRSADDVRRLYEEGKIMMEAH